MLVTWVDAAYGTSAGRFIRAQIFQPDGVAVGGELTLASNTWLTFPVVVGLTGGGFVLVGDDAMSIKAQIFDATGVSVGAAFDVTPASGSTSADFADVAALSNGGFAVSWNDVRTSGGDVSGSSVRVRSFSAAGVANGSDTLVNTSVAGNQADSSIAALSGGGYLVTWTDRGAASWLIKGQIFSANGTRSGSEFIVNSSTSGGSSVESSVATLSNGNFAVAWYEGSSHRIQIFTSSGVALGAQLDVPASYSGTQVGPTLAALSNGGFVIVWTTNTAPLSDGSGSGIYAQAFDANAQAVGSPMLVNTQTSGDQMKPSVVALANGAFAVTWTDFNGAGADDDEVRTQIFATDAPAPPPPAVTIVSGGAGPSTSVSIAENNVAVGQIAATPASTSQAISYSIIGGADAARFSINTITGAISFINAPNFETPSDIGANNVYDLIVRASDGTLSDTQTISVLVSNAAETPVIVSYGGAVNATPSAAENQTFAAQVQASDPDGGAISYSIIGGADAARFAIDSTTGVLNFVAAPNFEAPGDVGANRVYDVIVQASDGTQSVTQTLAVSLVNVVEPVAITSGGGGPTYSVAVNENTSSFTTIYTVSAANPEGGILTYSILFGADSSRFKINASTGAVSFVSTPNFESPGDAGANNVYDFVVQAGNGTSVSTQAVAVTVGNVNEAPLITGGAVRALSLAENLTAVTTVSAVDPEGAAVSYSLSGGVDAALFTINAVTGALSFLAPRNFEVRADSGANNIYDVVVRATDGVLASTQSIAVTITNVNEAPVIGSNGGGDTAAIAVSENATAVTTVASADPENTVRTYSIAGGADAALFTIHASTGALSFVAAPNWEAPTDIGTNNVYDVIVRASDGALFDDQAIAVTVTNVNEAPIITSNGGGATAAIAVSENTAAVTTVSSTDADSTARTYSIVGGMDASRFVIDAVTGALSFIAVPDFEAPVDIGTDNIFDVIVRASDGTLFDDQAIAVTVTNANEAPVITSDGGGATASIAVSENTTAVTAVASSDPENTTRIYSIVGGPDAARFVINAATGTLSFVATPDFETPSDVGADNVYDVIVAASDGTLVDTQALAVNVTNVDEGVTITSDASFTTAEDQTAIGSVVGIDLDGTAVSYAIAGGADAARFAIDASTGALRFIDAPNLETPGDVGADNLYDVIVAVTDGSFSATQSITVSVANVNEAPTITSAAAGVAENQLTVATVAASDVDSATLSYAISGGADAALFTIDAASGALSFLAAPDYEAPADAGADNIYDIVVSASDGSLSASQAIAVSVSNINEGVSMTATAAAPVAENSTDVFAITATDLDGDTLAYAIAGGADAAHFTMDSVTGMLSFVSAPDFEGPADADSNNIYDVIVAASDGTFSATQAIAVTVTNANEGVTITSASSATTSENGLASLTVAASDADGDAVTYAIVGGADGARFAIDPVTGALTFVAAPDFEAPGDADVDNVYDVTVSATDGSFTQTRSLALTVANVDEGLAITSGSVFAIAENATSVTRVVAVDQDGGPVTYAIAGGADAARFAIDAGTGALRFVAGPDFESPTDAGADNVYDVIVSATDGSFVDSKALVVTLTNVNEGVTITSGSSYSLSENNNLVAAISAVDLDGDALAYTIVGGADAARFAIDAGTGQLRFVNAPDFEAPADVGANNVYDVTVRASDGVLYDTRALAISVANANEPVTITSGGGGNAAALSVAENGTAATTVVAVDVDGGLVGYSIIGGADAARFTLNAATGVLAFVAAPNFEAPVDAGANNVYDVIVQASDGTLADSQALAITVTNVNEAPVLTSFGGAPTAVTFVGENTLIAGRVSATDPEGFAGLSYAIVGGADADRFTVNAWNGLIVFKANPNYEVPDDVGGNRLYDVVVSVNDSVTAVTQTLAINLTNVATESTLTGTTAANTINGTAAANVLYGLAGNDTLSGLDGNDVLDGGAGNDTLVGGVGVDQLLGGLGADTFRFGLTTESTVATPDFIADFVRAEGDRISVNPIDANTTLAGNQNFTFIGAAAFHNVAGELRYEVANGYTNVSGDVNGDGLADFMIQLNGQIDLVAADVVL